ncbi:MAG: hypothetical protein ACLP8X_35165 [Streptosporangiaceae bacterium]
MASRRGRADGASVAADEPLDGFLADAEGASGPGAPVAMARFQV